jgi:uncharacterized protein (TIGR02231 family)
MRKISIACALLLLISVAMGQYRLNGAARGEPDTSSFIIPITPPGEAATTQPGEAVTTQPAEPATTQPASAPSRVTTVTIYQGTALVSREVDVRDGAGLIELVVSPLPPETIDGSLFTESSDGIRVLTTRFRTRAVKEDTRAAVRQVEQQIKDLTAKAQDIQKQLEVITQNQQFIGKLEGFTTATMHELTDKGTLNAESTLKLAAYITESRAQAARQQVDLQHQLEANTASMAFAQRQLGELAAGGNRTERDAVIVVDKAHLAPGKVKLNYLVGAANWRPLYKLHAGADKDPVQVEYLASVEQQSGEDWSGVNLVLSTAQPMLNAAPPDLFALDISIVGPGQPAIPNLSQLDSLRASRDLRQKAQQELNRADAPQAGGYLNAAAASEQWAELLAKQDADPSSLATAKDGPSVAFHLQTRFTVPSRNDQQLVEVTRLELPPAWFYKTVPILSPHVYRLATLANKSKYVILPGDATMYLGADFVGRMNLPLVAIGEEFTAGFGVDPQIQVDRQLVDKTHSIQGGNQVQTYDYRIRVSSFKETPAIVQVWDRLPKAENETVDVQLVHATPELSTDPAYLRNDRPKNLLRWNLSLAAGMNGEKAAVIDYEFKLQYDRNVAIGNFKALK